MNEGLLVAVTLYLSRGTGTGTLTGSPIRPSPADEAIKCWCLEGILFHFFFRENENLSALKRHETISSKTKITH